MSPTTLVVAAVVVAFLYFAREVFIPLSLAVLLSFLLAMPCEFLERHGWRRSFAVLSVVTIFLALIGAVGWLLSAQVYDLARKLPGYHETIRHKLKSLKVPQKGTFAQASRMLREAAEDLKSPAKTEPAPKVVPPIAENKQTEEPKPIPVEVHRPEPETLDVVKGVAGPLVKPAATGFMVLVVLVFMLAGREDLRNRLIRLAGTDRMDLTTDALDEAANRVSRYLFMQLVVNLCYGLLIGLGLYFIGIPSPLLWGVLATILRFIPYAGAWISAAIPLLLAFAVDPGWAKLLWTGGLFLAVELFTANVIEPVLYGASTGVSPVALVLAAIFWTWMWGPVGLLLSTPLTVCLAVMGLHVPQLRFLHVLLGDEPVLPLEVRFYQRLLAMDRDEAAEILETFLKAKPLVAAYQEVIIPALIFAEEDRARGRLPPEKEDFVTESVRELIEDLDQEQLQAGQPSGEADKHRVVKTDPDHKSVAVIPAKDKADEIAGLMLTNLLKQRGIDARSLSADSLTSVLVAELAEAKINVVCISGVPPSGLRRARYLWKKMRVHFPGMRFVVGFWGAQSLAEARAKLVGCEPDSVVSTFEQAIAAITPLLSLVETQLEPPPKQEENGPNSI